MIPEHHLANLDHLAARLRPGPWTPALVIGGLTAAEVQWVVAIRQHAEEIPAELTRTRRALRQAREELDGGA